jgi:hypothetical protein
MNVLMDDVRTVKEIGIKGCRECRFSHGGAMFAATSGSLIQVYNSYTCEAVASLRYGGDGAVAPVATLLCGSASCL